MMMKKCFGFFAVFFAVLILTAMPPDTPMVKVIGGKKYAVHKVISGETLNRIASKYGATVSAIKLANKGLTENIKIGQQILVPCINCATTTVNKPANPNANNTGGVKTVVTTKNVYYKIKKGDTYYKIAAKYKVTAAELQKANGNKALIVGQSVVVPTKVYTTVKLPKPEVADTNRLPVNRTPEVKPDTVAQVAVPSNPTPVVKVDIPKSPKKIETGMPGNTKNEKPKFEIEKQDVNVQIDETGANSERMYMRHPTLSSESIVELINPSTGRVCYCKVIGYSAQITITKAAANKLGMKEKQADVTIRYRKL